MRLADAILRQGHLSEQTLIEVCLTGERPAHLDRCEICALRADEIGRWLEDVRVTAVEDADAAFPPERLAAQEAQILRRLEQVDRPARVIAFPAAGRVDRMEAPVHGIRPAWVGIAAAAGLVLGLLGGQISARLTAHNPPPPAQVQAPATAVNTQPTSYELLPPELDEYDRPLVDAVKALDYYTPHAIPVSDLVVRTNR